MTTATATTETSEQEGHKADFDKLKALIEEQFGPVGGGEGTWYDDVTIDRFLRARSYSIPEALAQFSATDKWRRDSNLEQRFQEMDGAWLRCARQCYPRLVGRCDRKGRPMFVFKPGAIDPAKHRDLLEADEDTRFGTIAVLTEHLTSLYIPLASSLSTNHSQPPVIESMSIVDLSSLSLRNLWTLRSHLAGASKLNSAYFPETLGTLVLVNTPYFFGTIWGFIEKWFDRGTREKIVVLDAAQLKAGKFKELVDEKDLPRVYGGELDWTYFDQPNLDQGFKELIGREELPDGPARWDGQRLVGACAEDAARGGEEDWGGGSAAAAAEWCRREGGGEGGREGGGEWSDGGGGGCGRAMIPPLLPPRHGASYNRCRY